MEYCRSVESESFQTFNFKEEFSHLKPELVDLLEDLISINPYFRPTARECLANPIFNYLSSKEVSTKSCGEKVRLDIDQDSAFDYDNEG